MKLSTTQKIGLGILGLWIFQKNTNAGIYGKTTCFSKTIKLHIKFEKLIMKQNNGNNISVIITAKEMLNKMLLKAEKDVMYCEELFNYFKKGSTIQLKYLLRTVQIDLNDLLYFNAFSLIDSNRQFL